MAGDGRIGLAVVGCGAIGRMRAEFARAHAGIGWIGLADLNLDAAQELGRDVGADLVVTDAAELIAHPEVDAVIVATPENEHVAALDAAIEHRRHIFVEKPLATSPVESARIVAATQEHGLDVAVGYTSRFRRRFITARQRIAEGTIGPVTTVVTRAFMNRLIPFEASWRSDPGRRHLLTPMVVSGTHALDLCLWVLEGAGPVTPVSVYATATAQVLGPLGTRDNTLAIVELDDGTVWSMNISWALPNTWPGGVYGLEIGIVGHNGVIDVEDTHRDVIVASEQVLGSGGHRVPEGYVTPPRHVDFVGSYPPGDYGEYGMWGPIRDETTTWYDRLLSGGRTQHATAAEGHRNLMLTMSMDLSANRRERVELPVDAATLERELAQQATVTG